MITIQRYKSSYREIWDKFVAGAKNGHFFFNRQYMEYHQDRFQDYSLLFFADNKLVGLLPANIVGDTVTSHGGLTFGGFLTTKLMTTSKLLEIFECALVFFQDYGIKKLIYKTMPYIYHELPAEEDRYALFVNNARLFRRDVLSVINMEEKPPLQQRRRRGVLKALRNNLRVVHSQDLKIYWKILEDNLQIRYHTSPVHTIEEILLLHTRFPDCIKLFSCQKENEMLAGVVIYETKRVAHVQYISSSQMGKKLGALDLIFTTLIEEAYSSKKYFDFGISNEDNGRFLNQGLIEQKEGFGGRAVVHDFYEIQL